jgi:hypothetical protein
VPHNISGLQLVEQISHHTILVYIVIQFGNLQKNRQKHCFNHHLRRILSVATHILPLQGKDIGRIVLLLQIFRSYRANDSGRNCFVIFLHILCKKKSPETLPYNHLRRILSVAITILSLKGNKRVGIKKIKKTRKANQLF